MVQFHPHNGTQGFYWHTFGSQHCISAVVVLLAGFFIGLWLNEGDGDSQIIPAGFDGFYTYFANEAVSYGSNPQNWNTLAK